MDRQQQERRLRREQRKYGTAPNGQRVDMQLLERLCLLGYDRPLAGEALRQVSRPRPSSPGASHRRGLFHLISFHSDNSDDH